MKREIDADFLVHEPEGETFDVKSARIRPADLAELLVAFANTKGGTVAIGVSDKSRRLEGISCVDAQHINDLLSAQWDCCRPRPNVSEEYVEVTNAAGQPDSILLLHVEMHRDRVTRTGNESVFVRRGDRTKELKGEALRDFEYSRSVRSYESECNPYATLADLDDSLLARYKQCIGSPGVDTEQLLRSRGMMRDEDGKPRLTHAAVLLFGLNVRQFYPHCRLRFVRYEGAEKAGGTAYNVIKDVSFDEPLPRLLERSKAFVSTQLRDFTSLEPTALFETVPEYPEFAWVEGIVNAVAHREYSCLGEHIRVSMFNDRLEIESPGRLPYPVTIDNICKMRRSRNPVIARVLTEMKWVRELNEGMPRIYTDMQDAFLEHPVLEETPSGFRLTLKNNIYSRKLRMHDTAEKRIGADVWAGLDDIEKSIVIYLSGHRDVKCRDLTRVAKVSQQTVSKKLAALVEKGLVSAYGAKKSPVRTYNLSL